MRSTISAETEARLRVDPYPELRLELEHPVGYGEHDAIHDVYRFEVRAWLEVPVHTHGGFDVLVAHASLNLVDGPSGREQP